MSEETMVTTGESNAPAAGETQDSFDLDAILFGDGEEKVEEQGDDNPETEPEQKQVEPEEKEELPEDASKAFAKKWSAEKDKIRDEVRNEIMREIQSKQETTPQQQQQGAPQYRELSQEELTKLADQFETSPAVMRLLHNQQMVLNQQAEELKRRAQLDRERSGYSDAQRYVGELVSKNPNLPTWDDKKIHEYRMNHYKAYGTVLPWKEAYRMQVADAVLTGDLTRKAQQETIRKIQQRESETVNVKAHPAQKPTISDLTKEQFENLVAEVKAGKYKRS